MGTCLISLLVSLLSSSTLTNKWKFVNQKLFFNHITHENTQCIAVLFFYNLFLTGGPVFDHSFFPSNIIPVCSFNFFFSLSLIIIINGRGVDRDHHFDVC